MIREGIADVANGRTPKGVPDRDMDVIDLDIGFVEYEIDKLPEVVRDLLPQIQEELRQAL
jgi:hypothetical protein